jgi:ribosomal protein S18 acetylase RimI-like enzyme
MQYLPYYTPEERKRHSVRPGLTGYAQVIGRNALEWDKRLEADLRYVRSQTLALDLWILYRTIVVTIMRSGVIVDPGAAMSNLDVERRGYLTVRSAESREYLVAARLIQGHLNLELFTGTVVAAERFPAFFSEVLSKRSTVRVVARGSDIVGAYQAIESEAAVHLNYIAVIESEKGWGTADLLMQDLSRVAAGRAITLHVDSRNSRAVSFYSRLGYVAADRVPMCTVIADGDVTVSKSRLVDPQAYARYGISYLELDGERVGIIDDRCLNVPIGASENTVRQCLKMSRGMVVRMTEECAHKVSVAARQSSFVVMQMVVRQ